MDSRVTRVAAVRQATGSATITITDNQSEPLQSEPGRDQSPQPPPDSGVLRLRGGPRSQPRVQWDEDVIDNEGCNKKKSKICCIYHKSRKFDESSDESSESDSESENDDCRREDRRREADEGRQRTANDQPRPNAYEIRPSAPKGKEKPHTR